MTQHQNESDVAVLAGAVDSIGRRRSGLRGYSSAQASANHSVMFDSVESISKGKQRESSFEVAFNLYQFRWSA